MNADGVRLRVLCASVANYESEDKIMSLKPLEVTTSKIATKAVTADKIADNAIENRHIKAGTLTPDKLTFTPVARPLTPALDSAEIKDNAITSTKIAPNTITTDHIAANAVANEDIKDGAISTAKIRDGAITREKVADQSVRTEDLVDGAVTSVKLASNSVTQGKIASNSVGASEIIAGAVGTSEIANGAVTQEKLAPGAGGGSRITWLPTRVQLTSLLVMGNQDWIPSPPNPSIPPEAVALIVQVELINNLSGMNGFINLRLRRDLTQQGVLSLGIESTNQGLIAGAQAIVPVTNGNFQYSFTDASGVVSVIFNPYVIGYIV